MHNEEHYKAKNKLTQPRRLPKKKQPLPHTEQVEVGDLDHHTFN